MTEMTTIAAAASVILKLCEDESDVRTKLKRISYAAAVLKRQADAGLEKIDSTAEVDHD
ncbi:hypothetical protein [Paraburkholderia lacunae]|uniref:hypothetical protein n=1 Tax=Paraburkholderia lacunae TaxID=2211104 RepID=UPI001401FB12|nr:hypothetical protein [Paraburkholderia lacunae]